MTMATANQSMRGAALTKLCDFDQLDDDEPLRAEIDGFAYAVFKVGELVFVTADLCSHGPGFLSEGYVVDCQVECPFHQGRFDLRTGVPTAPPCEVPIQTWTPVVEDGKVFIDPTSPNAI